MDINKVLILILIIIIGIAIFYIPQALRVYKMIHLYDEDKIVFNFLNMDKIFPISKISASKVPHVFETREFKLPDVYLFDGKEHNLLEALDYFRSDGMVVLHNGDLIYENYWLGNSEDQKHVSWSVAKSFLSALIGIALHKGLIEDLKDPITKYLNDFNGTGYEGIPIKDILQMSSGVKFNEDYADYNSDINRFGRIIAQGTSMRDFAKTLKNEKKSGTYNHYVSIDTQMLAMLLQEVTGKSITELLQKNIWDKIEV